MLNAWLPVAAYAALVFALSSMPSLAPPGGAAHMDKVAHLVEFGLMGALLARALEGRRPVSRFLLVILLGAVLAAGDEILQGRMGRLTSAQDWVADVVGVAVAAAVVIWGVRARSTGSSSSTGSSTSTGIGASTGSTASPRSRA